MRFAYCLRLFLRFGCSLLSRRSAFTVLRIGSSPHFAHFVIRTFSAHFTRLLGA
jgi:hypothetical protein